MPRRPSPVSGLEFDTQVQPDFTLSEPDFGSETAKWGLTWRLATTMLARVGKQDKKGYSMNAESEMVQPGIYYS
jgi:hypothetical protein